MVSELSKIEYVEKYCLKELMHHLETDYTFSCLRRREDMEIRYKAIAVWYHDQILGR